MLRISKLADYATVVLVYLARQNGRVANAKEVAAHTHLTVPTVSKLLKLLANSHILSSQRGVKGGYALVGDATNISVGEIIQIIEGQHGLTECSFIKGLCALEPVCNVQANWQLISHAIETALESVSIADLAKPRLVTTDIDVTQFSDVAKREATDGKG